MAASRGAADRSSELSAAERAAGGGVIMLFRVAKAFSRSRLTTRQIRPRFKNYLVHICEIPTRFLDLDERSREPSPELSQHRCTPSV